jgi:hypothetical protein
MSIYTRLAIDMLNQLKSTFGPGNYYNFSSFAYFNDTQNGVRFQS